MTHDLQDQCNVVLTLIVGILKPSLNCDCRKNICTHIPLPFSGVAMTLLILPVPIQVTDKNPELLFSPLFVTDYPEEIPHRHLTTACAMCDSLHRAASIKGVFYHLFHPQLHIQSFMNVSGIC